MREIKQQVIFGKHPVIEAIRNGKSIDKVFFQKTMRGETEKEVRNLCREHDIPLVYAPKEKLNKITKSNHQGVIAYLSLLTYYKLEDVLPMVYEKGETPLFIILDGITDVRNMGAIARSAEVCGAHALILPQKGSAMINAEGIKTSAGALLKIPVCRENSLISAIEFCHMSGIQTLASDLKGESPLHEIDLKVPTAFVVGSEGDGVSQGVLSKVNQSFIIPQVGETDSLNVSVASGIMMYEAMKQRL